MIEDNQSIRHVSHRLPILLEMLLPSRSSNRISLLLANQDVYKRQVVLDDLIPADHLCRVVDAFVDTLEMDALGFVRAEPADTGRPGYCLLYTSRCV